MLYNCWEKEEGGVKLQIGMNWGVFWERPRLGRGCSAVYGWIDGWIDMYLEGEYEILPHFDRQMKKFFIGKFWSKVVRKRNTCGWVSSVTRLESMRFPSVKLHGVTMLHRWKSEARHRILEAVHL
jgi:hypothetical protein